MTFEIDIWHAGSTLSYLGQVRSSLRRYTSAVYAVAVCSSVSLSVRHTPVMYRNCWTNRVGVWHRGYHWLILHCVI